MQNTKDVITSMFLPAAIVMIFTQMTGVVANIIDGVLTSRFLGADAYSSISLLAPMVNIVLLLASFVSIGGQIVCSHKIGTGQHDEANAVFTFSTIFGLVIAALFVFISIASPGTLFYICGVSFDQYPKLYGYMLEYLQGYMFGIPAVILTQVLSPFLVMDNGKKLVSVSAFVLCAADIVGDLLNVFVFYGGVFGMGAATSISLWLQLGVLSIHFARKSGYFNFSLKGLKPVHLKDVTTNGSLAFVKKLATLLRDIATNNINIIIAGSTVAIAAKGMQSDLNNLMFCFSIGIGRTLLTISSMYYGAEDKQGLKRVYVYAMKLATQVTLAVGAVLFVAAPMVSRIYTADPEVIELSVFSIRCIAVGLSLDAITEALQDYLQGIQNRKMVNILCFAERLFVPVIMTLVLGYMFGPKGIMASVAVGKVFLLGAMFIYLCVRNKGIPKKTEDYMFLKSDFGGSEQDNLYAQIVNMDDVIRESKRTADFCHAHGANALNANIMALFVEEMAGNIVQHGNPRNKGGICVDYRLFADRGKFCLTLRDYCEAFDPMKYYEIHQNDDPEANIGIRMVMKLAKDIRYVNAYNSNCLFIYLEV